ncbi:MAG: hypothetical protein IK095_02865 [Oscillospiraceae bacterium]|nr:hypothetical protein [Oscillospiraceae bacterium]
MKERLIRFMAGRNGNDAFNRFLLGADLILMLLAVIVSGLVGRILFTICMAVLGFTYFRMLSRDLYKRAAENNWYLRQKERFLSRIRLLRERWVQRKDYRFFSCPSCHTDLRVPRGKGKIKIVCRKCGTSFVRKS